MSDDRIEALVQQWEPQIRDAFLASIKDLRDAIVISRLTAMIKAGDVEGAIRAVGLDPVRFRPLDVSLSATFEAGGADATIAIRAVQATAPAALFDMRAFSAESFVRQTGASLVNDIMSDQGTLLRTALGEAVASGMNPHDAALELVGRISSVTGRREGGLIGLTSAQAQWVKAYEAEITGVPQAGALSRALRDRRFDRSVAKAIREGRAIPDPTRNAMLAAYRNRALKYRAEAIAQMESHKFLHQAQIEAYQQAIDKGAISRDQVKRFDITMGDARVRPEHVLIADMNAAGVGLTEPFQTPEGPKMYPPFDFGCRCRVKMVITEARVAIAA